MKRAGASVITILVLLTAVAAVGTLEITPRVDEIAYCDLVAKSRLLRAEATEASGEDLDHALHELDELTEEATEVAPHGLVDPTRTLNRTVDDYQDIFNSVGYDRTTNGVAAEVAPLQTVELGTALEEIDAWAATSCDP